jgi:putative FmdB family regulatory protein
MPIYEYACQKCGSQIEVMQKISDAPLKKCPKCRGKLEKMISRASFQLKGSGWYVTDYAKKAENTTGATTEKSEKTDKAEKTDKVDKKEKKAEKKSESTSL